LAAVKVATEVVTEPATKPAQETDQSKYAAYGGEDNAKAIVQSAELFADVAGDLLITKLAEAVMGMGAPAPAVPAAPAAPAAPVDPAAQGAPGGGEEEAIMDALHQLLSDPNSLNDPEAKAAIAELLAGLDEQKIAELAQAYPVVQAVLQEASGMGGQAPAPAMAQAPAPAAM